MQSNAAATPPTAPTQKAASVSAAPQASSHKLRNALVWVLITLAFAVAGSLGSANAPAVYSQLQQPTWAPPTWLFGPAWSVLYLLMAVAASMVWQRRHRQPVAPALWFYVAQLTANALWSWFFFAWLLGGLAFADSTLLLALLIINAVTFWRVRPLAGALMLPAVAWVAFATVLSWAMWQLNPQVLG
jgi:translocator protein